MKTCLIIILLNCLAFNIYGANTEGSLDMLTYTLSGEKVYEIKVSILSLNKTGENAVFILNLLLKNQQLEEKSRTEIINFVIERFKDIVISKNDDYIRLLVGSCMIGNIGIFKFLCEHIEKFDINMPVVPAGDSFIDSICFLNHMVEHQLTEYAEDDFINNNHLDILKYLILKNCRIYRNRESNLYKSLELLYLPHLLYILKDLDNINPDFDINSQDVGVHINDKDVALFFLQRGNVDIDNIEILDDILISLNNFADKITELNLDNSSIIKAYEQIRNLINKKNYGEFFKIIKQCIENIIFTGSYEHIKALESKFIKLLFSKMQISNILINLIEKNNNLVTAELLNKVAIEFNLNELLDIKKRNLLSYALEKQKRALSALLIVLCPNLLDTFLKDSIANTHVEISRIFQQIINKK